MFDPKVWIALVSALPSIPRKGEINGTDPLVDEAAWPLNRTIAASNAPPRIKTSLLFITYRKDSGRF